MLMAGRCFSRVAQGQGDEMQTLRNQPVGLEVFAIITASNCPGGMRTRGAGADLHHNPQVAC